MNDEIQTFVEFLLDTETTSETLFSEAITEKQELFNNVRNGSIFEKIVDQKLRQWKSYYQKEQSAIADRIAINAGNETSDEGSENESEQELSSDNDDENTSQLQMHKQDQTFQSIKQSDILIDPISQCNRLLQFLYYCQQNHIHLTDLYFCTLDHCVKSENEKIGGIALQQIALHLSVDINDEKECQRLIKCLPSNLSSPTIPEIYKPILKTIQTLISRNKTKQDVSTVMSSSDLDILYPYKARFLDLHREFRDSTHYFIDGDSLILSVAHHINIDLLTYYGNTLHVIFIIERILLTLFNQTQQCNYTLLFFDCHYQLYQNENSILSLLRACLISHLFKNLNKYGSSKVRQFSSWLDNEYVKFTNEEKPHFIFYHDMTSFYICKNSLLSKDTLIELLYIYRLFGNYHQYYLQCNLYLMNKLILTDTIVKCFRVEFMTKCPMNLLGNKIRILSTYQTHTILDKNNWIEFEKQIYEITNQDDVRLFLYIKTIMNCIDDKNDQSKKENLFKLLGPLLILHIALLIRLSLIDRHLPSNFASMTFSSIFSDIIIKFQQHLAACLSSYSSSLSYSRVVDMFDGRLFAFTLYQLKQSSSKLKFDSNTMDIVKQCLTLLKLSTDENIFCNIVEELIQSKHIIFSSSTLNNKQSISIEKQKITKISNPFIDIYLKPILSLHNQWTFDFVTPDDNSLVRYDGKYHWHVYKEVGDEISRIRDNDEKYKNPSKYRYRTKNLQKL
ncbi:unnamed protein product [Rotaria sp. Silwood2]|nr:unnamed protein product [Rotaria sp. Silwood2]